MRLILILGWVLLFIPYCYMERGDFSDLSTELPVEGVTVDSSYISFVEYEVLEPVATQFPIGSTIIYNEVTSEFYLTDIEKIIDLYFCNETDTIYHIPTIEGFELILIKAMKWNPDYVKINERQLCHIK